MAKLSRWTRAAAIGSLFWIQSGTSGWAQEGPNPAELFKQLDKNSDGKVTKDEAPEAQLRFFERAVRLGDANADGALTLEEFQKGMRPEEPATGSLSPGGLGGQNQGDRMREMRERLERLDRNGDGKISKDEVPEEARERMRFLFERAGREEIDLKNLPAMGEGPGPFGGQRPEPGEMFKRLDRNGDGKLEREELPEELRGHIAPLFDRLKTDSVTQDQFAEAARQMMGGGPGRPGMGDGARFPGGPEMMFDLADRNGDGKIEREEIPERGRRMFEGMFARAGKDSLTREDVQDFLRQMADRGGPPGRPEEGSDRGRRPEMEGDRNAGTEIGNGRTPPGRDRRPEAEGDRGPRPEGAADRGPRPEGGDRARRPGGEGDRGPRAESERDRGPRPGPEGGPDRGRRPAPPIMTMLDANGDHRISKDEFAKLANLFDRLDTNKDGELDPPELLGPPPEGMGPPGGPRGEFGPPRDGRPGAGRPEGGPRDGDRPGPRDNPPGRRPEGGGERPRRPE